MKTLSIVSPQAIRNHLANHSKSRIVHAFSKSKRFTEPNIICKQAFYNPQKQLTKNNKSFSIGKAKRSEIIKTQQPTPSPAQYQQASQFQNKSNKSKGSIFAVGRQKSPQNSYLYSFLKRKGPGPASYSSEKIKIKKIAYSIRPKTVDVISKHLSFIQNPGPGAYEDPQLNPRNGRFKISKFSDSKLGVMYSANRFAKINNKTPGPSQYKSPDNFNSKGKFILSHRRGKGTRPFDKQMRFTVNYWKTNKNPGPADYDKPSEFGIYGDVNFYKSLRLTH